MLGIEQAYGNAAIQALLHANRNLMEATIEDALRTCPYGKGDTLGIDAIPEISIATQVKKYDQHSILITEEQSEWPGFYTSVPADPRSFKTFFISDPTDRSSQFADFLRKANNQKQRVIDAMRDPESVARWEKDFSSPVSITGPFTAITCIRRGIPVLTVLINYLTQEMFVACSAGIFKVAVNYEEGQLETLTFESICSNGERIGFGSSVKQYQGLKRFVTFLGDKRKTGYLENIHESHLMEEEELEKSIFYGLPGGPSRILYLSAILPSQQAIGFILANGEKIGEWIHWLPFIRFARSTNDSGEPILHIYEVWHPRPHTKDGILMSTSPNYSVFRQVSGGHMVIDVSIFQRFANPSKIRSTLLVCLDSNDWAQQVVQRYGYRKIQLS
jgi:hypothetical protein